MKKSMTWSVVLLAFCLSSVAWSQSPVKSMPSGGSDLWHSPLMKLLRPAQSTNKASTSLVKPSFAALGAAKAGKVYKFVTADFPGAAGTQATGNAGGTVVGIFAYDPSLGQTTSFTFHAQQYKTYAVPGSTATVAFGIGSSGKIIGGYVNNAGETHGFVDNGGTFTDVDFPGAQSTIVTDINASDQMAGIWNDTTTSHGFLNNGGVFTSIDFPGSTSTQAAGINGDGKIVGIFSDSSGVQHGFIYNGGVFTQLDAPLSTSTTAFGINDAGTIAGSFLDASSVSHGFTFSNGVFNQVDVPGAAQTELTHIPSKGLITGFYTDQLDELHGFTAH